MTNTSAHLVLTQAITLGGGLWCTEAVFVRVKGVLDVASGYCNGHTLKPTYADVCTGETGHNEVVRLVYDPQVISLREVLDEVNVAMSGCVVTELNAEKVKQG